MKLCALSLLLASAVVTDLPTADAANRLRPFDGASIPATSKRTRSFIRRILQDEVEEEGDPTMTTEATEEPSIEEEEQVSPEEDESMDDQDDDDDGRLEPPKERICETESGLARVTHECKAKTEDAASGNEISDEIDFEVMTKDDGICLEVKYEQEIEEIMTETESKAKFEVCFKRMIEYSKAAGSTTGDAYDWVNDEVLQTIDLTTWDDFGEVLVDSSTGMSTFTASTIDGLVVMTFTITPAGGEERITANSMKADVRLLNFPWTEGADSFVALVSDVESQLKVETDQEEADELDEVEEAGDMPDDEEEEEPAEPTGAAAEPTEEMEEPEPTEEVEEPGARALSDGESSMPEDVTISFADVVDTIGFSPLGKVTWAETAVASTPANDTDPVAIGRAQKIVQVVATSPPDGYEGRYLSDAEVSDKTNEMIAFSFIGDGAQGSPDIFWDPEAGIDYRIESANSGVGTLASSVGILTGLLGAIAVLAL